MKQTKQKTIMVSLFTVACLLFAFSLIGCGGSSGGRQVLPGENPVGPVITGTGTNTGTNTGTSTGTNTGTSTGTNTGTGTDTQTSAQKLTAGWDSIDSGSPSGAIIYFDQVISSANSTTEERQQAYNGRGWARTKQYDTLYGMSDFIQGGNLMESRLGYALALIQQSQLAGISTAVGILEDIGLRDSEYTLTLEHQQIGVSSPEAHAMLAYAYFWSGDSVNAKTQILSARAKDSSTTSSVAQIYETLRKAGLTGI